MEDEKPALLKEFKFEGLWWFPENHEKKFCGILTYSPYEGATLEMMGDLEHIITSPSLILGMTINGKQFTLYRCIKHIKHRNLHNPYLAVYRFNIRIIFIGIHFGQVNDIQFNKISVHYSNLDEWLNIPIFSKHDYSDLEFKIKYQPEYFHIAINNDLRISINIIPKITFSDLANFSQISFIDFEHQAKDLLLNSKLCYRDFNIY